jgi:hypothetical protein
MNSFKRFEARQRALKRWAVVRQAVMADKFERARRRKRGDVEWLEHWKERKRTPAACAARSTTDLLTKLSLYFRDFRNELSSLCELYVPSELAEPAAAGGAAREGGSGEPVFSRRLKRQHLFAVLANCSLELTRYEIRRIVDHVFAL